VKASENSLDLERGSCQDDRCCQSLETVPFSWPVKIQKTNGETESSVSFRDYAKKLRTSVCNPGEPDIYS
jgi:hypothetical protein